MDNVRRLTQRDTNQIEQYEHDEAYNAKRVFVVNPPEIKVDNLNLSMSTEKIEGLLQELIKREEENKSNPAPVATMQEIKFPDIKLEPTVVTQKEIEIREIEKPVIVQKVEYIERPVIIKEIEIVEKPTVIKEVEIKLLDTVNPKIIYSLIAMNSLMILGLIVLLLTRR